MWMFIFLIFGFIVPLFVIGCLGILAELNTEKKNAPKIWGICIYAVWISLPALIASYFIFWEGVCFDDISNKICLYILAFTYSMPLSALAKSGIRYIPVCIAAILKEVPYILFWGGVLLFMVFASHSFIKADIDADEMYLLWFFVPVLIFAAIILTSILGCNILKALVVQINYKKLTAKIIKRKALYLRGFTLVYLKYQLENGSTGWCCVSSGIYSNLDYKIGEEIVVLFSPLTRLSYFNYGFSCAKK